MPGREIKIVTNKIYHVFNKTIDSKLLFNDSHLASTFLESMHYYRSTKSKISFSDYQDTYVDIKLNIEKMLELKKYWLIDVFAFCLMPSHFHFLLRQQADNGISRIISQLINSFTRYFNILNERKGQLFLSPFHCVEIRSRTQLIHVSRYVHLNPYSSNMTLSSKELLSYKWSSLPYYAHDKEHKLLSKQTILGEFNNDREKYLKFIYDNADYHKNLERLKYIEKWK